MYNEADLLALSGVGHLAFCERRWALIQIEAVWDDNRFTAEGQLLHERAHSGDIESRPGVLIRRTLPVRSFRLGIIGQADIVEFLPAKPNEAGITLDASQRRWRPYPIEYKRSRDKVGSMAYRVQLCAQALSLEEMFAISVPEGAIFDGKSRRRVLVPLDGALREHTEALCRRMHELFQSGATPAPVYMRACESCSLIERCLPESIGSGPAAARYFEKNLKER